MGDWKGSTGFRVAQKPTHNILQIHNAISKQVIWVNCIIGQVCNHAEIFENNKNGPNAVI